ncbi:MAG: AzlC family ABC transporter permease [Methylocystaceae bacterium]
MNLPREMMISGHRLSPSTFGEGVRDSIPIIVGVIPFGITCGIMALQAGLTPAETLLMSMLVFAGAAQFIAITMIGSGVVSLGVITFTTLLVNLRHLLMGASLAPYMLKLPRPVQVFLAFGMVDETYALTISRTNRTGYSANYQSGANLTAYVVWNISTAVGISLGSHIGDPMTWGLDFAMPATFLALLVPRLTNLKAVIVCLCAGLVAVLGALYLSGAWYIIIACLTASLIGGLLEGGAKDAA